jgi:hypothetical protein
MYALFQASALLLIQLWAAALLQQGVRELPGFDKYPVDNSYQGPPATLNTSYSKLARAYRTRLREGAKKGPNFAGHFTLVSWGCGTSCQEWAIIDARMGRVFDWVVRSTAGGEFYPNSRLLIVDSPKLVREMFGGPPPVNCAVCGSPGAYEWVGTEWRPIAGADMSRIRRY